MSQRHSGARRLLRRLSAAVVLVSGVMVCGLAGISAASAGSCSSPAHQSAPDGWTRIAAPAFATGPDQVTSYAVDPASGDILLASNGKAVAESTDQGCAWHSVFTMPSAPSASLPMAAATASVLQVAIEPRAPTHLYLLVLDAGHVDIVTSTNSGRSWNVANRGIVPVVVTGAAAPQLVMAPSDTSTLYLVLHGTDVSKYVATAVGDSVIYATHDGGQSWTPMTVPTAALGLVAGSTIDVNDLAVEPASSQSLWLATTSGLFHSSNSGTSWQLVDVGGSDSMSLVRVAGAGGQLSIAVFDGQQPVVYITTDDGKNWTATAVSNVAHTASAGGTTASFTMEDAQGVFEYAPRAASWAPIWRRTPPFTDVQQTRTPASTVFACTCQDRPSALYMHAVTTELAPSPPSPPPPTVPGAGPTSGNCMSSQPATPPSRQWRPSTLSPASSQLVLAAGQSATLHYRLDVAPRVLNVYFLADVGTKGEFADCPMKFGMMSATAKVALERNLRVGLGEFQDYTSSGINTTGLVGVAQFVYRRDAALGPVDGSFSKSVGSLSQLGGNDNAGLEALYQATTGVGQRIVDQTTGVANTQITGGQQAGFAPPDYNVILAMSGAYDNTPSRQPGYLGVDFGPAVAAMRAAGVHELGVWVDNSLNKNAQNTGPNGRDDMLRIARETAAISPTGIDCQGNGIKNIRAGDPLVCDYFAGGDASTHDPTFGREMQRLLEALRDPEPVRLQVVSGNASVSTIAPTVYGGVDWLLPNSHPFDVTVHCGVTDTGQTRLVQLAGTVAGRPLAQAGIQLTCGSPKPPTTRLPAVLFPPPPPPQVPPNPIPNPGPAPAANPAPAPAPNPAQMPQAQAQSVAQGAVVPQQEKQPQMAFAYAANQVATEGGDAMVALNYSGSGSTGAGGLGAGGLAAIVVCALGLTTTLRAAVSYVSDRPGRRDVT